MFLEIIKAILMGIVEGITEWLPISSTGHMILLEQVVKFNASEEFMSMFRVVIQLGAILAVVVLFWGKLWPFGLRHGRVISKPSVWQLWFKVVAATLPVLVISPLDDWMEAHFYNYITVAAMLILYGVLFLVVESRRTAPHVTHLEQITYRDALIIGVWQMLAIIPGTSRFVVIQMPTITQDDLEKLLRTQFPDLASKYVRQFALLFLDLQKKCDSAEISTKALDLRGMLDALRLIRRGIPAGAALDMGITNKAFDSYEQSLIRDVIAARIPAKLDAAKLFG